MKTVAYLRVSTAQQDVRSQRLAILEYARKHDFRIDDFIEATASGQASEKRRRLAELMNVLQRGDRLVVSELSRLGRSLGQIVAILDALAKAGVAFVAMKENIRIEGKRDIQTKVMTTLFALFAEVERDLISERTREGLAKARASGRKLGRPKGSLGVSRLSGKEDDIRRFLQLGVSKTAIAKLTSTTDVRSALRALIRATGLTRFFPRNRGLRKAANLYHDFVSGVRNDRPGLDSCLRALRKGDVLAVRKLDRLGRNPTVPRLPFPHE